jgi:hypothetical protein
MGTLALSLSFFLSLALSLSVKLNNGRKNDKKYKESMVTKHSK